ncbi:MAG TPA: hypothetical protein VG870_08750 [Chitinophagaceae bacterium]|nr:hypothetical protein [Chitinophagaceae bacterium]
MPSSHHRRKHKHVQPPPNRRDQGKSKGNAAGVMAFIGGVAGLAISYFAAQESLVWIATGTVAGTLAGFLLGRQLDRSSSGNS